MADTTTILIRGVPPDLYRALKIQAAKDGVYVKELIMRYLREGLQTAISTD